MHNSNANLEFTDLCVKGEGVKEHGADEGDVGGLAVEHGLLRGYPQAGQLRQHVDHFISLEIVNENIWNPEIFYKFQVHGNHYCVIYIIFISQRRPKVWHNSQSSLLPLNVEVRGERDAVGGVVDPEHLINVYADANLVGLVCVRKLKFRIIVRKAD